MTFGAKHFAKPLVNPKRGTDQKVRSGNSIPTKNQITPSLKVHTISNESIHEKAERFIKFDYTVKEGKYLGTNINGDKSWKNNEIIEIDHIKVKDVLKKYNTDNLKDAVYSQAIKNNKRVTFTFNKMFVIFDNSLTRM